MSEQPAPEGPTTDADRREAGMRTRREVLGDRDRGHQRRAEAADDGDDRAEEDQHGDEGTTRTG